MALRSRLVDALELFGLFGFSIGQPLYDVLARHPAFLVAHRAGPSEILALVAVLSFALPAIAFALELVVGRMSPKLGRAMHLFWIGLLAACFASASLERVGALLGGVPLPGAAVLVLAGVVGIAIAIAYAMFEPVRLLVKYGSVLAIVFPILFLSKPPVRRLMTATNETARFGQPVESDVPIVMVVFDEFALTSLLDENHQIDPVRYPNFAAFAANATWFRNASGVHQLTGYALPAIVTGNYPNTDLLPTAADHPRNLFTWLGPSYDIKASESFTELCPRGGSKLREPMEAEGKVERLWSTLVDSSVIYAHIVLPKDLGKRLPVLDQNWRDFLGPSRKEIVDRGHSISPIRMQRVERFIESIEPSARPTLSFLHILLPHGPWIHTPSGHVYQPPDRQYLPGYDSATDLWVDYDWLVLQAYQRHLLQLELVDRLIGQLMDHLKSLGLYDRSLIILTADHGISFWPGQTRRDPSRTSHPEDILCVPLLIKAPNQHQGEIIDRNIETVDILPTIADILKVKLPWPVDGHSAFDTQVAERIKKQMGTRGGELLSFDGALPDKYASLDRKLQNFGSGAKEHGLFRFGPRPELVGRPVSELRVARPASARVVLNPQVGEWIDSLGDGFVPCLVFGQLEGIENPASAPEVAVAVNGAIWAVVSALPQGSGVWGFSTLVPETAYHPGRNALQFFLVSQSGDEIVLESTPPVTFELGQISGPVASGPAPTAEVAPP